MCAGGVPIYIAAFLLNCSVHVTVSFGQKTYLCNLMIRIYGTLISIVILCLFASCSDRNMEAGPDDNNSGAAIDSIRQICNYYGKLGLYDSLSEKVLPFFRSACDAGDTAAVLYSGGAISQAYLSSDSIESYQRIMDVMSSYANGDMTPRQGAAYYAVQGIYALKYENNYSMALSCYHKALKYVLKSDDFDNQIIILTNITDIFYKRFDKLGLYYAIQALEISQNHKVLDYSRCYALSSVAKMYALKGEREMVDRYVGELRGLAEINGYEYYEAQIKMIYADLYYVEGDYDMACRTYEELISVSDSLGTTMSLMLYMRYGELCVRINDMERAESIYLEGLERFGKILDGKPAVEIHKRLSELYNRLGDGRRSYLHYLEYVSDNDLSSSVQLEKEFASLLLMNQNTDHIREIQEKELEILRANRRTLYISFILLLLAVLLVSIWVVNRRRQATYRALVRQYQNFMTQLDRSHAVSEEQGDCSCSLSSELFDKIESVIKSSKLYRQNDITLDKVSELVGTNRTYVSKAINHFAGMTFNNYINRFRIQDAAKMIAEKNFDIPFKKISEMLGFNSVSVFYKAFQRETGCTPGQYREQILRMEKDK